MTEYPRSVEQGGAGTAPNIAAQQETLGASDMRSPRGFLGSIVLLLAFPVAVLTQVLLGSGSSVAIHFALTVGCTLVALSTFDFQTPRWVAWIGRVAAGAFAAIFLLQAVSELIRNDSFSYFALQVLGNWPERVLTILFIFWLVAVLLTASRGKTRIVGFVAMAVVVCVEVYNYILLFLGEEHALAIRLSPAFHLAPPRKQEETTQAGLVVLPHRRSNGSHAGVAAVERDLPEAGVSGYIK